MDDQPLPSRPPQILGDRFHLVALIGRGGTSTVWRAHDELLDRDVAVKLLSDVVDEHFWPAIRMEARAAGRLTHARIAHMYDYGETVRADGSATPYLVMELVDGEPLSAVLAREGPLPWRTAATIGGQIAEGLAAAHRRGLVHRDIKPDNVLLTADGVKIIDFGIAAVIGSAEADEDGSLMGTAAYLAPERLSGGTVGPAIDVYALGVLLYYAIASRLPWDATGKTEILHAHAMIEPALLPAIGDLPEQLVDLCAACLAKDPLDRPSAADLARLLPAIAAQPDAEAVPAGSVARRSRLSRRPVVLLCGLAAIVLAGTGAWALQEATAQHTPLSPVGAPAPCRAMFAIARDWGTGFDARLTITNTSSADVHDWHVTFTFPGTQQITSASASNSPATLTQTGTSVSLLAKDPSQIIQAGHSIGLPITGTYTATNPLPTAASLDGRPCLTSVAGATTVKATTAPSAARPSQTGPSPTHPTAPGSAKGGPPPTPPGATGQPTPAGSTTPPSTTPTPTPQPVPKPTKTKKPKPPHPSKKK